LRDWLASPSRPAIGLVILGAIAMLAHPSARGSINQSDDVHGVEGDRGVQAIVEIEGELSAAEAPLAFSVSLINRSDDTVTIWLAGFWANHQVIVLDADGNEPPLTESGRLRRSAFRPAGTREKNLPLELEPGDSHVSGKGALTTLYELGPGRYTLQVTYDDRHPPTPLTVAAKPVDFQVIGKVD